MMRQGQPRTGLPHFSRRLRKVHLKRLQKMKKEQPLQSFSLRDMVDEEANLNAVEQADHGRMRERRVG